MRVDAFAFCGHHLVGRNCYWANFFFRTRVLTDFVGREVGALEQFVSPLAGTHCVCHQDQRGRLRPVHG